MSHPLIHHHYLIEKQDRPYGWTYVVLPVSDEGTAQSLPRTLPRPIRVRGHIGAYEFKQFILLPMKDGSLMLPINAAARKKTGKKAGDTVEIILYLDDSPVEIPDEVMACLVDSEPALQFFLSLSGSNQKYYIDWVEESKTVDTKVARLCKMMERLEKREKFWDW
jgi:Domain of unknown function (DUF1905)/Bacteriocin-protection, YdeI or OmpD-Associated